MTEDTQTLSESTAADESAPVSANPAIAHCMNAWECVFREKLATGKDKFHASQDADKAYRNTMPPLSGYENIRDFIACTAHAMLIGIIREDDCCKLLYAAQVALGAVRSQPRPPKSAAA
jgi:hypothetical protein